MHGIAERARSSDLCDLLLAVDVLWGHPLQRAHHTAGQSGVSVRTQVVSQARMLRGKAADACSGLL